MNNIVNSDAFNARCQMVIVPISTAGTISNAFKASLDDNKISFSLKKEEYKLGEIEVHKIEGNHVKFIVFACSVEDRKSNYVVISSLAEIIGKATKRFPSVKRIGMPLLGTGAGGLDHLRSINILFDSFYKTARLDSELIFCVPDYEIFDSLKRALFTKEGVNIFRIKELIIRNIKTRSKRLDLGNCGIRSLDILPELFNCEHLEELILSNEWGEYNSGRWVKRKSTNIGIGNILDSLPAEIKNLKKLKILICGGDWNTKKKSGVIKNKWGIKDISMICSLSNLVVLNVSNNDVENVGEMHKLVKLEKLYLNNNKINYFPNILNISALREVYLSNNELSDLDFLSDAVSIRTLDIHSNNISNLFPLKHLLSRIEIGDSKWTINAISVSQNPLQIPAPEVVVQGREKVLAYFKQLEAEQSINLKPFINYDIKLILVGNSNAGKSTLLHWLKNKNVIKGIYSTHWMVLEDKWQPNFNGKSYTIRVFDFGGQEYYHDTHHLFFTNNTAYLILWEEKTDCYDEIEVEQRQNDGTLKKLKIQTFPLTYWLASIKFHTERKIKTESEKEIKLLLDEDDSTSGLLKDQINPKLLPTSSGSQINDKPRDVENILVVQNKVDSIGKKVFVDQKDFKDNYSKISDFLAVSIWNQRGLDVFQESLFQVFDSIIGKQYLGTWGVIKTKIESTEFDKPYSLDEFKRYCNVIIRDIPEVKGKKNAQVSRVLFSDQDAQSFAQYLNEIGIVLYFPEDEELKDKIFLNPQQVLKNIYNILLDLDLTQGRFEITNAIDKLNKTAIDEEVIDTINLMLHFKIVFQHPAKVDNYIAPLYLPKEPIESIKIFIPLFHKPIYRYEYKNFIYKNVILGFFQSYGKKAMKESNSLDHYYYWKEGIVLRDDITEEIVMVKFIPVKKGEKLAYIEVYRINSTPSEVFINQVIQDIDSINKDWDIVKTVTANGEDFIPLAVIHKNEEEENWIFKYGNRYYKLTDFKKHFVKPIKMKNLFISYSKQDFELVAKFVDHLSALQLDGKVAHWYCSELIAGSEWDKTIQKHFDEADIICFMISPNFMKTKYIHEYEIAKAFERKARSQDFRIVPIILDFCRWNTGKNDLSQFTALPYTAKPVVDFDNQNMAWYIIQECLRIMIDEDLDPKGEGFYSSQKLPSDVQKIYARIVAGKVDNNSL